MVEIKVTASAIGTLVACCGLAVLNAVAANNSVLGSLPPWLQFTVLALLPPLITFLSGYATPSTTSEVSVPHYHRISGKRAD